MLFMRRYSISARPMEVPIFREKAIPNNKTLFFTTPISNTASV
jgi:hypothetical protein